MTAAARQVASERGMSLIEMLLLTALVAVALGSAAALGLPVLQSCVEMVRRIAVRLSS
jgi:type II secretory pathway pseudopilin PulG